MAVKEDKSSRKFHETINGLTITVSYTCTRAEYDARDSALPYVGRPFNTTYPWCRCTDIKAEPLGKDDCRLVAVFSSDSTYYRQKRANQATSWQEAISISMVEQPVDGWYKYGDASKDFVTWKSLWSDSRPVGSSETPPEITHLKPRCIMTLKAYGSIQYFKSVLNNVGSINRSPFLFEHLQVSKFPRSVHDVDIDFNDEGKWMFIGCEMTPIRQNCWEYQFQFVYSPEGWNTYQDIPTSQYGSFNMASLLVGMSSVDVDSAVGSYA